MGKHRKSLIKVVVFVVDSKQKQGFHRMIFKKGGKRGFVVKEVAHNLLLATLLTTIVETCSENI